MKPRSILKLEEELGIEISLSTVNDFFDSENKNTFKVNDNGEIISLNLFENKITNISFIKEFENLKELDLRNNPIKDFRPLENLKKLILFGYNNHTINSQSYIDNFLKKDIFDISRHSSKIAAIYIHNHEFLFDKPQIINLGGKNNYYIESYDDKSVALSCKPNINYIEHFFGEDIALVSAIVGENGTGKTSLLTKLFNQLIPVRTGDERCVFFVIEETDRIKYYSFFNLENDFKVVSKNFDAKNEKSPFYGFPIYFSNYLSDSRIHQEKHNSIDLSLKNQILNDLNPKLSSKANFSFYKNSQLKRWMKILSNKEITTILDEFTLPVFDTIKIEIKRIEADYNYLKSIKNLNSPGGKTLKEQVIETYKIFNSINIYLEDLNSTNTFTEKNTKNEIVKFLMKYFMTFISNTIFNQEETNRIYPKIKNNKVFDDLTLLTSSKDLLKLLIDNFYFVDINDKNSEFTFPFQSFCDFILKIETFFDNGEIKLNRSNEFNLNFISASEFLFLHDNIISKLNDFKIDNYQFLKFHPDKIISSGEEMVFNLISLLHENKEVNTNVNLPKILFLDEADLGLHPKWKKMFVNTLVKILPKIFIGMRIQIIFTTHDPLTLSDIPNSNIVYLKKENGKMVILNDESKPKKSFGANITDLLADSFFVDNGLMGDFAKAKIENTIEWINLENYKKDNKPGEPFNANEYNHHKQIIELIDEPILKMKLAEMIDELKGGKDFQKELARKEIDFLKSKFGIE
ncbi:AAA family ATPase [Flavobacterium sp. PL002]|uniref:AAA family ATPase n=1 Tax=Flavobacterium sp. PL002 TaxID=1897058 RepID=UPI001787F596|nr:AAA family ATPase [Flavobacterium sp. PL002]MBE0393626.1 hypothetical protein [Flavobacterium sp. PL002]